MKNIVVVVIALCCIYPVCQAQDFPRQNGSVVQAHPYWPSLKHEAPEQDRISFDDTEKKQLWPGDIVFRLSYGFESFMAEQLDGRWSHIGIIDIGDGGAIYVIHSHGADETHSFSGVQREPFSQYLRESREIKVMRFAASPDEGRQIAHRAASLIGKKFDTEFSLNNDKYYCSEVVLYTKPELFSRYTRTVNPRSLTSVAQLSQANWPEQLKVFSNSDAERAISDAGGRVIIWKKIKAAN